MVVHVLNPSYSGGRSRRITVPGWPGQKQKTLPKKQTKANIAVGISWQISSPHFKTTGSQKKKKKPQSKRHGGGWTNRAPAYEALTF
jgi:hypothetical protein